MSEQMTDAEKLRILADWFDKEEESGRWGTNQGEVQADLRRIAAELDRLRDENADLKAECERLVKDQRYSLNQYNEANARLTALVEGVEAREAIAAVMHEVWSHWMKKGIFPLCSTDPEGNMVILRTHRYRWMEQAWTPYTKLSDAEKASDRDQADKVLAVIRALVAGEEGRDGN